LPAAARWSISANTLTGGDPGRVTVYSLGSGHHHRVAVPSTGHYVSAAPGGFVYADGADVSREQASGHRVSLGQPLGPLATNISGASSDNGVVVTDDAGGAAYVPFDDPTHPVTLDTTATTALNCQSVSTLAVACVDHGDVYDVPLNGSSATVVNAIAQFVALSGDTAIFDAETISDDKGTALFSFQAGSTTVTQSSGRYLQEGIVGAYGKAITTRLTPPVFGGPNVDPDVMVAATSATDVARLFVSPSSPETAGAFALTNDRIAYTADVPVKRKGGIVTVLSRSLSTKHGKVRPGPARFVGKQHGSGLGTTWVVAASHGTTVFASSDSQKLRVVGPHRHLSLMTSVFPAAGNVQLAGRWLLNSRDRLRVFDLRTHKVQVIARHNGVAAALSGNYLAYALTNGSIYRMNLITHKTVRIAKGSKSFEGSVNVFEAGPWVGWQRLPRKRGAQPAAELRNAATMAKPIRLQHTLVGLTSSGAVLATIEPRLIEGGNSQLLPSSPFWLRSYAGHTHLLLSKRAVEQVPDIHGGRVAWISASGQLEVAPLR
jgi:hypothetical protein